MNVLTFIKKVAATAALGLGQLGTNAAHAGIPVIDVASLAESIQQVLAWGQQYGQMSQQYQQMLQQYQQQIQQYQALTGTRNLGNILNNPALQQAVPGGTQLMQSYASINSSGFAGLSNSAQSLRSATAIYDCSGRIGQALQPLPGDAGHQFAEHGELSVGARPDVAAHDADPVAARQHQRNRRSQSDRRDAGTSCRRKRASQQRRQPNRLDAPHSPTHRIGCWRSSRGSGS